MTERKRRALATAHELLPHVELAWKVLETIAAPETIAHVWLAVWLGAALEENSAESIAAALREAADGLPDLERETLRELGGEAWEP